MKTLASGARGRIALLLCAGWTLLAAAAGAEKVTTEVDLDPDGVIGVDEVTVLEIKISVEGAQVPSIPDPVFELENFRIVGGPSQSTGLTIVDGQPSAKRALSWQLMPRKLGTARVHSVRITIEGQEIEAPSREVKVVRQTPRSRRLAGASDPFDRIFEDSDEASPSGYRRGTRRPSRRRVEPPEIFLRAGVSPARPYVGQQVIYTLNLYTQVDINSVNPEEFPDFKGFWARVIPQPDQLQPEMVEREGERFGRVVLIQRALFPRRAGTFEIEPISARMVARMSDSGPFGSLTPRSREIVRQSNGVTIQVRDLPAAPAGFQGAVGQIELTADLTPAELEVGEAATFTLKLSGRGHLQGIPAPQIPEIPGIEIFPPQQQSRESLNGKNVYGNRTWSFVLVPERPGEWQLPPIEIPYFDPGRGRYEVASTAAIELTARGVSVAPVTGSHVELHPIRDGALPATGGGWRVLDGAVPWLFGLPWLAALVVLLVRRRAASDGGRPARQHLLARLSEAADEQRPRQAAAEIGNAWRDFLHDRWEIPPGSPSTQWGNLLVERGMASEGARALVKLADDIHYLRYAPKLSSISELQEELLERSRKLARAVG